MKNKHRNEKTLNRIINITASLGLISFFLSFWVRGYFWNFFGTGFLFLMIAFAVAFSDMDREKKDKC